MTGYETLIDAETRAFIAETAKYYPDDTVEKSIEEQRAVYDAMCRAFFKGYPQGMRVTTLETAGVPCRTYRPEGLCAQGPGSAQILFLHGGGFVVGNLESHDDVCAELSQRTGLHLTSVNYRLAPEHKHPAAFDDCLAVALETYAGNGVPLVLVGDSAGGNLAAAVSHVLRDRKATGCRVDCRIRGQVLIYPALGGDQNKASYTTHAHAPMLTRADMKFYQAIRCSGPTPPVGDVTFAPLEDPCFENLPETHLYAAECDPLCDDAVLYHQAIQNAGGKSVLYTETGLVHGYLRARYSVKRARDSFERIISSIATLAQSP